MSERKRNPYAMRSNLDGFSYPRYLRQYEVSQREMQNLMNSMPDSSIDAYAENLGLLGRASDIRDAVNSGRLKMYTASNDSLYGDSEFEKAYNAYYRSAPGNYRVTNASDFSGGYYMPRSAPTDTARILINPNNSGGIYAVPHEFGHEIFGHHIGEHNVPTINEEGMRNFALMGRMGNQFPTPNELLEDAGGDTLRAIQEYKQIYGKHDGFVENPYDTGSRFKSMFGNILGDKSDFDTHTHYHPDMTDRDFEENFAKDWFYNVSDGTALKLNTPAMFEKRAMPAPAPAPVSTPAAPLLPSATSPNFMNPFNPSEGESFFDFLTF